MKRRHWMLLGALIPGLVNGQEGTQAGGQEPVFDLDEYEVRAMEVLASRAIPGVTPVAFSTVDKDDIMGRLASRDLPLALNTTPSAYATNQGGGAGDARINIRGFNQRNVAVMINGVPVNDMENGWVYWSNWDGIGDVASSIQLQRGMSNLNLAVPSIGGTLNILTDPAAREAGGMAKLEVGSDSFVKATLVGHSGLLADKWAVSAALVRKTGDSYIDGVWTDAWAWFVGAAYHANEANTFEFYAMGAPQRHGQNLYQRNIGTYSESYARGLAGYDEAALERYYERGFAYNETWNFVDNYNPQQAAADGLVDRHDPDFINERENFYDKPLVNFNWYYHPDSDWQLDSVLYYSGGEGGGTGTLGSVARVDDPGGYFHRNRDWNAQIGINRANLDANGEAESTGILRNSRNNQWTIGAVSRATYEVSDTIDLAVGVDWRTAEIEHYRQVRDLLGGDYYRETGNEFWTTPEEQKRRLGEKVNYDFTNTVDWLGGYLQGNYDSGDWSAFAMTGYSQIQYEYENFFVEDPNNPGRTLTADSGWIDGIQMKGGVLYRLNDTVNFYGNLGYVEKVPIFDAVIDDRGGQKYEDPKNEKFTSYELGVNYLNEAGTISVGANVYRTNWEDRTFNSGYTDPDTGEETLVSLGGVNQIHQGVELEGYYIVNDWLRFEASVSLNQWEYDNDVNARYRPENPNAPVEEYNLYIDGLKVGDAPQTQFALTTSLTPVEGFQADIVGRYNTNFYADFDPLDRTDPTDRTQSWKIPSFWVWDLHLNYTLPLNGKFEVSTFLHVLNVLDEEYIQDATDNDRYNSWDGDHDADDAAVFFGAPRTFNAGVSVRF